MLKSGFSGVTLIKGFHRFEARASTNTFSAATNALRYTRAEQGSNDAPQPRIIMDALYLGDVEDARQCSNRRTLGEGNLVAPKFACLPM